MQDNQSIPYVPPKRKKNAFNCPYCQAYAKQDWQGAIRNIGSSYSTIDPYAFSFCACCTKASVWHLDKLIFPPALTAPLPNPDMPDAIKLIFEEARQILGASPRGAAALLRLCIEMLCKEISENKGKNLKKI